MRVQRALSAAIQNRDTIPTGHFVKGSVVKSQYQIETYRNLEVLKSGNKKKTIVHATNYPKLELDLDFLSAAAESYCISPNPEDYILVSLPIVSCSIPTLSAADFRNEGRATRLRACSGAGTEPYTAQ